MNIVSIMIHSPTGCLRWRICNLFKIYTIFTKGPPRWRHFLQCFGSKHSLLWFTTKNFEPDTAWTDQKSGL